MTSIVPAVVAPGIGRIALVSDEAVADDEVSLASRDHGTAMGPLFSGLVYDLTGSYQGAFTLFAVGYALAAATIFMARPPRPRSKEEKLTPTP